MTPLHDAMAKVLAGGDLTEQEARDALGFIMDGEATPAQTAGFLIALKA